VRSVGPEPDTVVSDLDDQGAGRTGVFSHHDIDVLGASVLDAVAHGLLDDPEEFLLRLVV
jgi:hypothetical protein